MKGGICIDGLKIWLYGRPFSGKTKFATEFEKPFVINTDGNARLFTSDYCIVKNIDEFADKLNWFLKGEHEYKTLIIDVLEHVYDFVRTYYLDKYNIDHESDAGWGKAYKMIREGFWNLMKKMAASDYTVVFVSHEEEYTVKDKLGREITHWKPAIDDKLHDRLCGIMQLVGRCYVDEITLNGVPLKRYFISFGSNVTELSGVRIPLEKLKIENNYEEFKKNIKEIK